MECPQNSNMSFGHRHFGEAALKGFFEAYIYIYIQMFIHIGIIEGLGRLLYSYWYTRVGFGNPKFSL